MCQRRSKCVRLTRRRLNAVDLLGTVHLDHLLSGLHKAGATVARNPIRDPRLAHPFGEAIPVFLTAIGIVVEQ